MSSNFPDLGLDKNIDQIIETFCKQILEYADQSIPKIKFLKRKSVP